MPEETNNTEAQDVAVEAPAPGVLVADSEGLLSAVEDRLKERTEAGDVLEAAVEELVEGRLTRRTQLLRNALEKVKSLNKEEKKIKPKAKGFTRDGEAIEGEVYDQCQVSRLKQIEEQRAPIVEAIAAQNYDKLSKLGF